MDEDPTLTPEEIFKITHYRRATEQLRELEVMGIPAYRRHDNTVCVFRAHMKNPAAKPEPQKPRLRL